MSNNQRGSGLISSLFGVCMMLLVVLAATNVAVNIYTRSVVSAAAHDAARRLAAEQSPSSGSFEAAEARARQQLGTLGRSASTSVIASRWGDYVTVSIVTRAPALLPSAFGLAPSSITATAEAYRAP